MDNQNECRAIRVNPEPRTEYFSALVRSVLNQMDAAGGPDSPAQPETGIAQEAQQVLFDIDLDGIRYLLIKSVQRAPNANRLNLSPRQREIVRRVALGHQNKVIAAAFGISTWTVSTHLRRIFTKLGVTSRAAMVAKAAELVGSADWQASQPVSRR